MTEHCGTECEVSEEELADAIAEEAMVEVLHAASTEQLRDELTIRGYRVRLESR